MMTSRSPATYPAAVSEPEVQWAYARLWRLLIPVFMGLGQRFSVQFGTTLALSIMLFAHVVATADWEGCQPGAWLLAASLAFRQRFGAMLALVKSGDEDRFER